MAKDKSTIVFLSTYPPRECGIATFTQDLLCYTQKFLGSEVECKVAAFNLSHLDTYKYPPEVKWKIDQNSKKEHFKLAKTINNDPSITGVIIQHEYGIYGGEKGENILAFVEKCKKPLLVTLHTVLPEPSSKIKSITSRIIKAADTIVVLTQNSKQIIEELYPYAIGKTFVVPHGIHPSRFSPPKKFKERLQLKNHTILTTFGLLSRGKGIEYAIKALPEVVKKYPSITYLILGSTHPVIRRQEGEKYRLELLELIKNLNLKKHVRFYDQYLSLRDLLGFLKATDIYIATSTNPNQSVSGTLSYALGSGRAVVSTEFAQAKEIITPDTGRLVPIKDSRALTQALMDLLSNRRRLTQMHAKAYEQTRSMLWSNVAKTYTNLLVRNKVPELKLDHLQTMTDDFGFFQFAKVNIPDKDFGYTLDDNARALVMCNWLIKQKYTKELKSLIVVYVSFIKKCLQENGSFINYIGFADKLPTKQNDQENLEEAQSRALWGLSETLINKKLPKKIRNQAKEIFLEILTKAPKPTSLRSKAFTIKAFSLAQTMLPKQRKILLAYIKEYADFLLRSLKKNSSKTWYWFEDTLTYNNGLLPESLLIASRVTKNTNYKKHGILALQFLISKTFGEDVYMPVGSSSWYKNNHERSYYDQQPEEPAAMIIALKLAYEYTHKEEYKNLARKCFSWFFGNNSSKLSLYDEMTGGCRDGLLPNKMNPNQGAESLVSYLMSNFIIKEMV